MPNMSRAARPRLLIADDDPVLRSVLCGSLSGDFVIAGVAKDAEEAVQVAGATRPAAALVDVEMPMGGGLSAVQGILAVSPDTAIVVLSGDESENVVRDLIGAGAVSYRRKGTAPEVLAETLLASIAAHGAPGENPHSKQVTPPSA